jgi:hypothetical protein
MSSEERIKILKMVEEGKITVEEGARLIEALNKQTRQSAVRQGGEARWLRVKVMDLNTGKESVRVNLPISLVDVGIKMGARFIPDAEEESMMEDLAEALKQGLTGKIIEVIDEEEGQRVEIFVE